MDEFLLILVVESIICEEKVEKLFLVEIKEDKKVTSISVFFILI